MTFRFLYILLFFFTINIFSSNFLAGIVTDPLPFGVCTYEQDEMPLGGRVNNDL